MHIFEGNSGKPILSLMRPGKRPSGEEAARVLWHVIHRIRRHWPDVRILVRGDSHFCAPEVLDLLRRLQCDYILGLSINPKLAALAKPWRESCAQRWWTMEEFRGLAPELPSAQPAWSPAVHFGGYHRLR